MPPQAEPEIAELVETAQLAAAAGGEALLAWRGRFSAREKGPADYVTDADLASQKAVFEVLEQRRPGDALVGEEKTDNQSRPVPGQVGWVVDPLDGTTNYLHDYPCFAVSIGAVRDGELLAGVVLDPVHGERFWAGKGAGAWLGDERIETARGRSLREALVALSLPAGVQPDSPDVADLLKMIGGCQAIRRTGSAALNLAYVACGRLDAHWAREIHPWDVAAGVLLIKEAGGVVTGVDGRAFDLWEADFLAAGDAPLHAEVSGVLAPR